MKGDVIRVLDIILVGPVMIAAGHELRKKPLGGILAALGLGTIAYNFINLSRNNRGNRG
jgi:hypothetical protein